MATYVDIRPSGGATGTPINLQKRLAIVTSYLPKPVAGVRLLDGGCGNGAYLEALIERYGIDGYGLEYFAEKVSEAHQCRALKDRVQQGDLSAMPFPDGTFDAVLLNEVLEHVPNEAAVLAEIRRVLKSDGRLIVFSPNRWYPFEAHGAALKHVNWRLPPYTPFVPYVPLWIGRKFIRYSARNYGHFGLRSLIRKEGFEVVDTSFVWQTFENISGRQPRWMGRTRTLLRGIANALERTPVFRRFGVSQIVVARPFRVGSALS